MRCSQIWSLALLASGCFSSSEPVDEGGDASATGSSSATDTATGAGTEATTTTSGTTTTASTDPTMTTSVDESGTGPSMTTAPGDESGSQTTGSACGMQTITFEADLAMGMCEDHDPGFGGVEIDGVRFIHDLPDVCLFPAVGPFSSRFVELLASTDGNSMDPNQNFNEARIVFPAQVTDVSLWIGRKSGSTNYAFSVDGVFLDNYDATSDDLTAFAHPGPLGEIWITWNDGVDAMIGIDDLSFCL